MRSLTVVTFLMAVLGLLAPAAVQGQISVTLTVEQPPYFYRDANVTVQWQVTSGQFDPTNDYITSWWAPFTATYLQYFDITANSGSATFDLINGRNPIFFRYYRGDQMIAQSDAVIPESSFPMQVHVQFVPHHPDRALVIWVSNRTTGYETVFYGTTPGNLQFMQNETTSKTYTHNELATKVGQYNPVRTTQFQNLGARDLRCVYGTCYNDSTATELYVDPGQFHFAELSGLTPNTVYYFVAGEANGFISEVHSFHSRVATGAGALQVLYVADAGVGRMFESYSGSASHNSIPSKYGDAEGARHVWDAIRRDPLFPNDQVTIMNGDISYARGWPWIWELFGYETEDIFTSAPVMAIYGNHEYDYGQNPFSLCQGGDSGGEAGIPTGVRFNLEAERPWYHMSMGPITFVTLSTEHSVTEQQQWLETVLPAIDRTATPFVVVFLHRPIHESSTFIDHELQAKFENQYTDLFSLYGVDLVLSGHAHYYERMCHINSGVCDTWGFRPGWNMLANQKPTSECASNQGRSRKTTLQTCKAACLQAGSCTGAYISENGDCYFVTCPQPFPTESSSSINTYNLTQLSGTPPVYIVDGTAGGAHTPTSSPTSPITRYKDFSKWGYSRITATNSSLTWTHYHVDGNVVDTVTLDPVNA